MRQFALWNVPRAALCVVLFVSAPAFALPLDLYAEDAPAPAAEQPAAAQENDTNSEGTGNIEDTDVEALPPTKASAAETVPAASVNVVPVVANEKAQPRDIIKKELILTNNTDTRRTVYISVRNIDPETGDQVFDQPGDSDLSVSLANWIEITRGAIELSAGESRKIPYLIHVNLTAEPGSYFARIGFHEGGNKEQARASETNTELILNVEVESDARERLQLGTFMTDKNVVLGGSVGFSYLLENIGNRLVEPRGSIRIFNRRGEEVGSIPVNASGEAITPENKRQLAAAWETSGRFGKYKAFLDLEYGEEQLASVQDTLYFWVFPWKEVFVAMIGVLVLAVLGTFIVHMRAVARPAPARVYQTDTPSPPASAARTAYMPSPAYPRHTAHQQASNVVLAPRTRASTRVDAPATPAASHGTGVGAVALQSRARQAAQVSGDTVSLAPRR